MAADEAAAEPVRGVEREHRERPDEDHVLLAVAEHVMPHLVAHHEEELALLEPPDDRVPQHDALRGEKAGDVGIDLVRVDALLDLVDARALDARALREHVDRGFEPRVLHRTELVEQRRDPDRIDDEDHEDEGQRERRRIEPPAPRAAPQQRVNHHDRHERRRRLDGEFDRLVREPLHERLVGEPEAVLHDVAADEIERQREERREPREDDDVDQRRAHAPGREAPGEIADARGPPHEEEEREHRDPPGEVDAPEGIAHPVVFERACARLGDRDERLGLAYASSLVAPPIAFQAECPPFMYDASKPASRNAIAILQPT